MTDEKDDVLKQLMDEETAAKERIKELNAEKKKRQKEEDSASSSSSKVKAEEDRFTMPQEFFRKILSDLGFSKGSNVITDIFFSGDIDNAIHLDNVLKKASIPAKSRELIILRWYGKMPEELGVKIETTSNLINSPAQKTDATTDDKKAFVFDEEIQKMSENELKSYIASEKTRAAMAQLRLMREEAEQKLRKMNEPPPSPQQAVMVRRVMRPILDKDGNTITKPDGTQVYETIEEPVSQHGGGTSDIVSIIAALKSMDGGKKTDDASPAIVKAFEALSQKVDSLQQSQAIREKDDYIKRLEEKFENERKEKEKELKRVEEEHKKELKEKEEKLEEKMDRITRDNEKNLENLKERFMESLNHRKELDDIIGAISDKHKREMDDVKKRLDNAQTSIERTVVAKGTDTIDKLSGKVADIAESVVKPMAEVWKDHYATVIDSQRKQMGLPDIRTTIPKVTEEELNKFVEG